MGRLPFDPPFAALPAELPIFPLPGALLLPGGRLPLNVFEPRYLAMVQEALRGDRLIGMVQPERAAADVGAADTFAIGCAGRIVEFSETDDGRIVLALAGLIRFRILAELPKAVGGYRRVRVDYAAFADDLAAAAQTIDRPALEAALKLFFRKSDLKADWSSIKRADDESLVTALAMSIPLPPGEKQALLEAPDLAARARTLAALLALTTPGEGEDGATLLKN